MPLPMLVIWLRLVQIPCTFHNQCLFFFIQVHRCLPISCKTAVHFLNLARNLEFVSKQSISCQTGCKNLPVSHTKCCKMAGLMLKIVLPSFCKQLLAMILNKMKHLLFCACEFSIICIISKFSTYLLFHHSPESVLFRYFSGWYWLTYVSGCWTEQIQKPVLFCKYKKCSFLQSLCRPPDSSWIFKGGFRYCGVNKLILLHHLTTHVNAPVARKGRGGDRRTGFYYGRANAWNWPSALLCFT